MDFVIVSAGSVLLQDEASHGGDVAIDMDMMSRNRFQQQMQVVEDQVNLLCGDSVPNFSAFGISYQRKIRGENAVKPLARTKL